MVLGISEVLSEYKYWLDYRKNIVEIFQINSEINSISFRNDCLFPSTCFDKLKKRKLKIKFIPYPALPIMCLCLKTDKKEFPKVSLKIRGISF